MSSSALGTPAGLAPSQFYGLRTDIQYNAHYLSDADVLYPAGGVLVIHNHLQKKQKFIRLVDKHKPIKSIVLAPNRRWLALNEIAEEGKNPIITIYDLTTNKRRKILTVPFDNSTATEFACVQFTYDSKYLVAVTGEPDWYLYYYNWDKGKVESHAKAQNPSGLGTVANVQCNPTDATLVVITGPGTFRIMNVLETVWRQWGWCKAENLNITACTWLTQDRILIGTETGVIMMIENGELRQNCIYKAMEVIEMNLKKVVEEDEESAASTSEVGSHASATTTAATVEGYPVTSFVNFPKGFVYACGPGFVHMFEKETLHKWRKRNLYRISRVSYKHMREYPIWSQQDAIQHMTVDPNQEYVLITTLKPQLYHVKLFGQHMLQNPEIPFSEIGVPMHNGNIIALSMCAWKPIFVTAGQEDRSVRIWNYITYDVELIRIYQEEIHSLSLHPTGLYIIIGFADKLRYLMVLIDDLEVMREFPIRMCKACRFSNSGNIFAAVNGSIIQLFSSVSFKNIYNLKGHNAFVTGLSWSALDVTLVSCGSEGAVYEWDVGSAQRTGELIQKSNEFLSCAVDSFGKTTFACGTDGEIKEIASGTIRRSLGVLGICLDNMVLSRSDLMLFLTCGLGSICTVLLPLADKAIYNEYHMHNKRVTKIALSYDDQTLISVAEDSTVCIWRLTNAEGRAIALDKEFAHVKEILISKKDLQEKLNTINLLTTRMSELETEQAYQIRQMEAAYTDKLKEVHEGYGEAIVELKEKNEQMDNEHTHEMGMIQQDIAALRSAHERALQTLEADFNMKLIGEYDKYQALEDKTARLREEYERRLEELAESKRQALRDMNDRYERKLEEKDILYVELEEKYELNTREHENIKSSIEDDADREIIEIRTSYETQLREEKDANVRLKGETGIMKKKLIAALKDIDEFKHQILQLKAEHKQFQKVISSLERDVTDLKKEIQERDCTIQEKERRIHDLKRKNQELEKYKFVLNFKINELKNLIEPMEQEIQELSVQIDDMEGEELKLINIKEDLELKLVQVKDKLVSAKKDYMCEVEKKGLLKNTLKKIKIDLHNMTANFQDPIRLKNNVKILFQKYVEDEEFIKGRIADDEATREFNRQRDHLERQVASLKQQLAKSQGGSKNDIGKIMDENCTLLGEINELRAELKKCRTRCSEMESILGVSGRYMPPAVARAKLTLVTEDRDRLDDKFRVKMNERDDVISNLREENERLQNKMRCMEGGDLQSIHEANDTIDIASDNIIQKSDQ